VKIAGYGSSSWNIPLNLWSVITNFLGLQILFYPLRFFVFWYVSALLVYYLLHALIKRISGENTVWYFVLAVLALPVVALLSKVSLPIYGFGMDTRIVDYYYMFFFGVILYEFYRSERLRTIIYPIAFIAGVYCVFHFTHVSNFSLETYSVMAVFTMFLLAVKLKFYRPVGDIPGILKKLSSSTYSVYLLQYPVICTVALFGINNIWLFIVVSVIVTFACGYLLQSTVDKIFEKPGMSIEKPLHKWPWIHDDY